jgi:hypothetical protein
MLVCLFHPVRSRVDGSSHSVVQLLYSAYSKPSCRRRPIYWPDSCLMRLMYAALTWFHAAMYFSMQVLVQLSSLLDRDLPGFGTHFSKQFSWSFYMRG